MKQLIEKKIRTAKILLIASIVIGICTVIIMFLAVQDIIPFGYYFSPLVPETILLCKYFGKYSKLNKCWKGLTEAEKDYYVQGMNPDRYTLQYSCIYCGFNAIFATRPYVILPYSEIAWIYYEHTRAEDSDEVVGLNIRCRNGKKFQIEGDDAELKVYAESYIPENFPDILVGRSEENQEKFYQICPKIKNRNKIALISVGVILGLMSVLGVISTIARGEPSESAYVIILLVPGIFALWKGIKY